MANLALFSLIQKVERTFLVRRGVNRGFFLHFWHGADGKLQYPGEKIKFGFYGWAMIWNMGDTDSTKEWKKALLDYTRSHLGISITISPF